ncbi:MAG: HIT domain-containing protein [Bacilli bacterium]|nr:HIT domain-containing protein [Bacilli bacterium]
MNECIFCKIVNKDIPAKVIYEDELVMAYLDISPIETGHTLIIPKTHYTDLDDISEESINHIMKTAKIIKKRIEEKLNPDGIKLVQNNGSLQEVKHYHLHIIPHYNNKKDLDLEEVYELLK